MYFKNEDTHSLFTNVNLLNNTFCLLSEDFLFKNFGEIVSFPILL